MPKEETPLKKTIDQLLRAYGYQDQLDEIQLIKIYKELVGQVFANHTQKIGYKNRILYVKLDSASLKQELNYVKEGLVENINRRVGRKVVDKIVIK
jgi:predicted nucleic acid-binding Zn ribbon protein